MSRARQVVVLGLPLDENSSFLRGAAAGPEAIRRALYSASSNLCAENGVDLGEDRRWKDLGDLELPADGHGLEIVETRVSELLGEGARVVSLGGDHSVTYPLVRAHSARHRGLTVLHLDAHADLYDEFEGSRVSHACPFARIMEEGLAEKLVQVGVRTLNSHQRQQAERFGVEVYGVSDFPGVGSLGLSAPLYLSLDLDVLDPAFAPGVSHHEPGGLSTRQVLDIVRALPVAPVGADIVELNPGRDVQGISAMVAAKLLKEVVGRLLANQATATTSSHDAAT